MTTSDKYFGRKQDIINKINTIATQYNVSVPAVEFNISGWEVAGRAILYDNIIRLNINHVIHYFDDMITDTVPHEMAHVIAYKKYESTDHCDNWKSVMRELGISDPQLFHKLEPATWRYTSKCCGKKISTITYNRIKKGKRIVCDCGKFIKAIEI